MKTKWKFILGGLAGLIIIVFIFASLTKGLEANLLVVEPQTIANTFKEEGKVVPLIEQPIYAPYSQEILLLAVKEGQEVKKGDMLAVLDSKELTYQLRQFQAQLTSLQGEYESTLKSQDLDVQQALLEFDVSQASLKRIEELFSAGALPKKDLEDAQKIAETARINLEQKKALRLANVGKLDATKTQIEHLEYQIGKSTISSPGDGIVANLTVKRGELAQATLPIMTIFQKDSYLIETYILTEDVQTVGMGMEVILIENRKDGEQSFIGKVKELAPSVSEKISALGLEEQRIKVTIEFPFDPNLKLLPGYRLDVQFTTDKRENKLVVPKTVLFPYKDAYALWVVENGKAKVQEIEKGFENDQYAVIEKGLEAGDLVILNPQLEGLKEGKKVKDKLRGSLVVRLPLLY
ncbi:MAG: hypothetical protein JM58_07265 [Peptococcaceae bacterium BICA1-8]|nr:MAG: hypothetical protein JM58_07265 [Peptococcaceae bacterium BICA1-8]